MTNQIHTSGRVAADVGLARPRLLYLIETEQLPQPTYAVPGRRVFTDADVEAIRRALEANPELREPGRRKGT